MEKLSFCINTTGKEKEYLSLLLRSMEDNFYSLEHEIIIFIDSLCLKDKDNEDVYGWLMNRKFKFKDVKIIKNHLPVPIGYASNINLMFEKAKYEIVSYLQSDMVVGKNYDAEILRHLEDENTVISSTRVEPPIHPPSPEKYTAGYGLTPDEFDYDSFNTFVSEYSDTEKRTYYWFAPFTILKKKWLEMGGHDTLFRRSREDSDMLMRFRINGMKVIQSWSALVYHFTCVSSRGKEWFKPENNMRTQLQNKADQIELMKFFRKWKKFEHNALPMRDEERYLYDCTLSLKNCMNSTVEKIVEASKFFETIYLDDERILEEVLKYFEPQDIIANELLGYSSEDWEEYKIFFNRINYSDVFMLKNTSISKEDIVVEFDIDKLHSAEDVNFLNNLNDIIHQSVDGDGKFKYNIFKVTVNNKNNIIMNKIFVNNPSLDKLDFKIEKA